MDTKGTWYGIMAVIWVAAGFLFAADSVPNEENIHLFAEEIMENDGAVGKNKEIVRQLYERILNTRQLDTLGDVIGEDYAGIQGERGPEGFAGVIQPLIAAFPDIQWTIEDIIADGEKVVVRLSWTGTNTAAFRGIPATNKRFSIGAITIYRISGGRIRQAWMETDRLGFLQQLGIVSDNAIPQVPVNTDQ